ncbi:MAG: hypothetical protein QGG73_07080 [Candidatus Hydrogenedentes bacterium]|nr:hypothetical protein [Candidatus Hydrogenedentota bacterium]
MKTQNATRARIAIILAIVGVLGLSSAGQQVIEKGWDPFGIGGHVITAVVAIYNTSALDEAADSPALAETPELSKCLAACPPKEASREIECERPTLHAAPRASDTLGS